MHREHATSAMSEVARSSLNAEAFKRNANVALVISALLLSRRVLVLEGSTNGLLMRSRKP